MSKIRKTLETTLVSCAIYNWWTTYGASICLVREKL